METKINITNARTLLQGFAQQHNLSLEDNQTEEGIFIGFHWKEPQDIQMGVEGTDPEALDLYTWNGEAHPLHNEFLNYINNHGYSLDIF